jgi:hypothetical protein
MVVDTLMLKADVFSFNTDSVNYFLEPWLIGMWALLPIIFNHSISWLKKQKSKQFFMGGIGGLISYWGGEGLDLLVLKHEHSVLILFCVWAMIVIIFFYLLEILLQFFSPK